MSHSESGGVLFVDSGAIHSGCFCYFPGQKLTICLRYSILTKKKTLRKGINMDIEHLRELILNEFYAGAFAGMPAMLMEAEDVKCADYEDLIQIAERYGLL